MADIDIASAIDNTIWYWVAIILIVMMVVVIIFYSLNKVFEMRKNASLTRRSNNRKRIKNRSKK